MLTYLLVAESDHKLEAPEGLQCPAELHHSDTYWRPLPSCWT